MLLEFSNERVDMMEEVDVSLSHVFIHRIEKQHHHNNTSYHVFINTGRSVSPSVLSTLTR